MSTAIFPTLLGQGWDIKRTPLWRTRVHENESGKESRLSPWLYPRWSWEISFNVLRQGVFFGSTLTEFSELAGFFNNRRGRWDSFLYKDQVDFQVTAQALGTGTGARTTFQLVRSFGGFVEPIYAPDVVTNVFVDGVDPSGWTVQNWGDASPGLVTFASAPGSGLPITATFSYRFPVRFEDDKMDFVNFVSTLHNLKKVGFRSIK